MGWTQHRDRFSAAASLEPLSRSISDEPEEVLQVSSAEREEESCRSVSRRLDESKPASIATLNCTGDARLALFADIPQTLQEAWSHRVQLIDSVEQSAVIMALTLFPSLLARSDIL